MCTKKIQISFFKKQRTVPRWSRILIGIVLVLFLSSCDTKKNRLENIDLQFACYVLAVCDPDRGVKFGMVGDSWTDLVFGLNVIESLRVQLETYHQYKIVGATQGGQEMVKAYQDGVHIRVINEAGPNVRYMLLSLGGNDIQYNPSGYVSNMEAEKQRRFALVKTNLLNMVRTGNVFKINRWGGGPLTWIIHGYDYTSPDKDTSLDSTSCRTTLSRLGFSSSMIQSFLVDGFNEYNEFLKSITFEEPTLRYIDLRGTLGGPNFSNTNYMYDCIHPNSIGFRLVGERYAKTLQGYTNNER